ncbi:carboxypeptidase-like regulatory domain-containing protein [Agarivorans sp. 1_MG-2023]|uniref:carboxypeptidase-like regulatory domain-containing protein n=1 Tax=Agarivorans sp. 1_MG-2023 TaxID=3062634 RepID=UPI0026E26FEF|nr:carboxypeptidase-like regulatory domain-containing protein [Agarivorans sp. 1_MG-2023]MDO6762039.1 carboxypeptidase-like regulatory domain-containing protein [Agarivorans sp. 1_MG-2023]
MMISLLLSGCPFWDSSDKTTASIEFTQLVEETAYSEIKLLGLVSGTKSTNIQVSISINANASIAAEVTGSQFSAWLELEPGVNTVVVTATINDRYEITKSVDINFTNNEENFPTSPINGSEIIGDSTALSGTFYSTWSADDIVVYIDNQAIPFELVPQAVAKTQNSGIARKGDVKTIYQYRFTHWVDLVDGNNEFHLKIVSPDSIFHKIFKFLASIIDSQRDYSITLEAANSPTEKDKYQLNGQITTRSGKLSDLRYVELHLSNSLTGESLTLSQLENSHFSANMALEVGENTLTVVARKAGRSLANASVIIQRNLLDTFSNITPTYQQVVTQSPIVLSGDIETTWPLSDIKLTVNGESASLVESALKNKYTFSISNIALSLGENQLVLKLSTPNGNEQIVHQIIYQPAPDTTPPTITLDPLPNTTTAPSMLFSGSVVDPKEALSGVEKVTITNEPFSTVFNAVLMNDRFSAEVPLAYGNNEITVSAADINRNISTEQINIKRYSTVKWTNIKPTNHSVVSDRLITISGELHVPKGFVVDGIRLNQLLLHSELDVSGSFYRFSATDIPLDLGNNTFTLIAQGQNVGTASSMLNVLYRPSGSTELPNPEIALSAPLNDAVINDDQVQLLARINSYGGAVNVDINGESVTSADLITYSNNDTLVSKLSKSIPFPAEQSQLTITINVSDSLGNSSSKSVTVTRDTQTPVISVNNYLAIPAVNQINQSTFTISGLITDDNLSSATINDGVLKLTPTSNPQVFSFSQSLDIAFGEEHPVLISAFDFAGNQVSTELRFILSSNLNLSALLPPENAIFMLGDTSNTIQVATSYQQLPANTKVVAWIDKNEPILLNSAATVASGELPLPKQLGEINVKFAVLDSNNQTLAAASRTIQQVALDSVDLALTKVSPKHATKVAEPTEAIELYFNQKIDLTKLEVKVLETLNGHTYVNNDAPGTDFLQAKGYTLQQVFRNREPVDTNLALLPSATTAAVYPSSPLGYGATIEVEVVYAGKTLSRHQFTTRPLPTLITGAVSDQFNQTLAGIKVEVPALQLVTTTNADGGFAFGYQDSANESIAAGTYTLIVNRAMNTPGISEERYQLTVKSQRLNERGLLRVSQINTALPAEFISSGNANTVLAGGDVTLDLSNATVLFPEGFNNGHVYMQLAQLSTINAPIMPEFAPLWAFAAQPKDIQIEGLVGTRFKLPKYQESYDYLSFVGNYMMLVAYNSAKGVISPIGVAEITDTQHLITPLPVALSSLNYVGASWIPHEQQSLAEQVANGEASLIELTAAITQNLSE